MITIDLETARANDVIVKFDFCDEKQLMFPPSPVIEMINIWIRQQTESGKKRVAIQWAAHDMNKDGDFDKVKIGNNKWQSSKNAGLVKAMDILFVVEREISAHLPANKEIYREFSFDVFVV